MSQNYENALGRFWINDEEEYHREDGPAVIWYTGDNEWYLNGELHRMDGPAKDYENGYQAWFYHGKWINCQSQEEFERIIDLLVFN